MVVSPSLNIALTGIWIDQSFCDILVIQCFPYLVRVRDIAKGGATWGQYVRAQASAQLNNFSGLSTPLTRVLNPVKSGHAREGLGSLRAISAATGWKTYLPLAVSQGHSGGSVDLTIFALHLSRLSSMLGACNIVSTIMTMRVSGQTLHRMLLFVWAMLVQSVIIILANLVLAGALTMIITDRNFNTTFFDAAGGGDPVA